MATWDDALASLTAMVGLHVRVSIGTAIPDPEVDPADRLGPHPAPSVSAHGVLGAPSETERGILFPLGQAGAGPGHAGGSLLLDPDLFEGAWWSDERSHLGISYLATGLIIDVNVLDDLDVDDEAARRP